MDWLNIFGLIMIAVIMIPNIILQLDAKRDFKTNGAINMLRL